MIFWDSSPISFAITPKLLPCSPAEIATIDAFKESNFVSLVMFKISDSILFILSDKNFSFLHSICSILNFLMTTPGYCRRSYEPATTGAEPLHTRSRS